MRWTTWRLLLAVALLAGVVTWAVLQVSSSSTGTIPDVPWPSAVVLAVFAGAVLVAAIVLRPRIRRRPDRRPLEPVVAARFAALSLACSRVGALFIGVYAGFAAAAVTDLSVAFRRHLVLVSGVCVLAAALLMVAGLVLERVCRVPPAE